MAEPIQGNEEALSGLNDEDKKILEDLQREGNDVQGLTPEKPKEPETPVVVTPKEPATEAPKEPEPKIDNTEPVKPKSDEDTRPRSRTVPAWELAKQQKEWAKEKGDLQAEISKLSSKPVAEAQDDVKAIAEKYGITEPGFVQDLIDAASKRSQLPAELVDKIKEHDHYAEIAKKQAEDGAFVQDFEKDVLPLVREEYPEISDADVARIRDDVKKLAYSEKLLSTPLSLIYKGDDAFRGVVSPKKKTAESGRGGESRSVDLLDFDSMSESDIGKLSPENFIKYSEHMAAKEHTP